MGKMQNFEESAKSFVAISKPKRLESYNGIFGLFRSPRVNKMASGTDEVRETVALYFEALHQCDGAKFDKMWHPAGKLLGVRDSEVVVRGAAEFREGAVKRGKSEAAEYTKHDKILTMIMLDDFTAAVKVQIALPPAPDSPTPSIVPTLYTDWLVMLRDKRLGWRVISKIFSAASLHDQFAGAAVKPCDYAEVAGMLWDGYRVLCRDGSKEGLAAILHEAAQATRAERGKLEVKSATQFAEEAAGRWGRPEHAPYAHLQHDPSTAHADSVLSVDFAGPGAAMAAVRIGIPPFLSTEVLSLLKVGKRWRIVAQSGQRQPFMLREAR